jgi:hypothetical protein
MYEREKFQLVQKFQINETSKASERAEIFFKIIFDYQKRRLKTMGRVSS